jgi:hypothetical protein
MTRFAALFLAALAIACLGASSPARSAQDEKNPKKPGKKPPVEEMDKEGGKKNGKDKGDAGKDKGETAEKKDDEKSDADKPREPADEKQKKQFDKIKIDVERKFKKSKREQVYVYATSERTMERVEPAEEPAPTQTVQRGRNPNRGAGAAAGAGHWEPVIRNTAYLTKDREDAVEKVYKFLVEYPPPAPGARKKKKSKDETDEPPPPERALLSVNVFPATKEGERQAEAALEQLENRFMKEQRQIEAKKQARMKGKN